MTFFEAAMLGIIQGLTEFLPVSSSGHIELGKVLLDVQTSDHLLFSVVVHFATALSTIIIFRKDIGALIYSSLRLRYDEQTAYVLKLLLSMVPVGIVGVLFEEEIENFFTGNIVFVGCMLIVTGMLLTFTYYKKPGEGKVTYGKAMLIGLAQAIAILPGISRSGATISTGLLLGVEKSNAARFSFIMVLIPILGATALKLKDYWEAPAASGGISAAVLFTGFMAAFLAGLLACTWMIRIVKKGKLIYFAVYCFFIGALAVMAHFL
jgi:undecaprenyl-diphosphatase